VNEAETAANVVDEGRAWLRQHGGGLMQAASEWIGFEEGVGESHYGAGKGLVQLAQGAQSLTDRIDGLPIRLPTSPASNRSSRLPRG
jgi:hypothetical protein